MNKPKAEDVLADMLAMIESDLMKAHYYLEKAVKISLIAQPDPSLKVHRDIARASVAVAQQIKHLNHLQRLLMILAEENNTAK